MKKGNTATAKRPEHLPGVSCTSYGEKIKQSTLVLVLYSVYITTILVTITNMPTITVIIYLFIPLLFT